MLVVAAFVLHSLPSGLKSVVQSFLCAVLLETLYLKVPMLFKRLIELASEKGASNWLTILPLEENTVFSCTKLLFLMLLHLVSC